MKSPKKEPKMGLLIDVAKAVGKATGTVASLIGTHPVASESDEPGKTRGRLTKKKNSRTPRHMKKAMKKRARREGKLSRVAIRRSA